MSRQKGSANLAASLEVQAEAPLDARTVVALKSDLTNALNFPYAYVGMPVFVKEESKLYTLTAADVTTLSNWKEVGGGGALIEDVDDLPTGSSIEDKFYRTTDGEETYETTGYFSPKGGSVTAKQFALAYGLTYDNNSGSIYYDERFKVPDDITLYVKCGAAGATKQYVGPVKSLKFLAERPQSSSDYDYTMYCYSGKNYTTQLGFNTDSTSQSSVLELMITFDLRITRTLDSLYMGDRTNQRTEAIATSSEMTAFLADLQSNFQDGVDSVYDAVVAKGSTPASKALADVVTGIANIPSGITPTGTKNITSNGTYNVTNYASAKVAVPITLTAQAVPLTQTGTFSVTGSNGDIIIIANDIPNTTAPSNVSGATLLMRMYHTNAVAVDAYVYRMTSTTAKFTVPTTAPVSVGRIYRSS